MRKYQLVRVNKNNDISFFDISLKKLLNEEYKNTQVSLTSITNDLLSEASKDSDTLNLESFSLFVVENNWNG